MEPLICPQCGGQISDYSPEKAFTTCAYCGTRFLIEAHKQSNQSIRIPPSAFPDFTPSEPDPANRLIFGVIASIVAVVFGVIIMGVVVSVKSSPKTVRPLYGGSNSTPRPSPTA